MTRYLLPLLVLLAACGRSDQEVENCAALTAHESADRLRGWYDLRQCLIARYDWDEDKASDAAGAYGEARRAELAADSLARDSAK